MINVTKVLGPYIVDLGGYRAKARAYLTEAGWLAVYGDGKGFYVKSRSPVPSKEGAIAMLESGISFLEGHEFASRLPARR